MTCFTVVDSMTSFLYSTVKSETVYLLYSILLKITESIFQNTAEYSQQGTIQYCTYMYNVPFNSKVKKKIKELWCNFYKKLYITLHETSFKTVLHNAIAQKFICNFARCRQQLYFFITQKTHGSFTQCTLLPVHGAMILEWCCIAVQFFHVHCNNLTN